MHHGRRVGGVSGTNSRQERSAHETSPFSQHTSSCTSNVSSGRLDLQETEQELDTGSTTSAVSANPLVLQNILSPAPSSKHVKTQGGARLQSHHRTTRVPPNPKILSEPFAGPSETSQLALSAQDGSLPISTKSTDGFRPPPQGPQGVKKERSCKVQSLETQAGDFPKSAAQEHVGWSEIIGADADEDTDATEGERKLTRRRKSDDHKQRPIQKAANIVKRRKEKHTVPVSRIGKPQIQRRPGHQFEMQWRVGQAPKAGPRQSQEQIHYQNVLSATVQYYSGNAEAAWKFILSSQNTAEFDQNFEVLRFDAYMMSVAGLITAGRAHEAYETLNMMLPFAKNVLLSQHPMACWFLIEQVMDTSQNVVGNLRAHCARTLASLADDLLGNSHPLTVILKTPLSRQQRIHLRLDAQKSINSAMTNVFGPHAYQTFIQFGCLTRMVGASGNLEEATRMLSQVTEVLEQQYGLNSAMPVLSMIEQARLEFAAGSASVKLECMLGDALRRNYILSTQGGDHNDLYTDAGESALRTDGLSLSRIAALRLLGRVHMRRRNFGAAIHNFEQAVIAARTLLKAESSSMKSYEADLELSRTMEIEQAMGVLSIQDPSERLVGPLAVSQFVPAEHRL